MKTLSVLLVLCLLTCFAMLAQNPVSVRSTNGFATNLTANGTFAGNGGGLTNIQASNIVSLPAVTKWVTVDDSFGSDAGQVQQMAYLAALQQQGLVKIAYVASCIPVNQTYGITGMDATLEWYGVFAPLGCRTNTGGFIDPDSALTGLASLQSVLNSPANAENAVTGYRRTLVQSINNHQQITMFFQAQLYNLYDLFNSTADGYSPLNGSNLLAAANPIIMYVGGVYPNGNEYNFTNGVTGVPATQVLNTLPPNIQTWGVDYNLGTNVTVMPSVWYNLVSTGSPVGLTSSPRPCWGEALVMAGVFGTNYYGTNIFSLVTGTNVISSTGSNTFTAGPSASMSGYLQFNANSILTFSNAVNRTIAFAASPQQNYGYGVLNIIQTQAAATTQVGIISHGNWFPGFFVEPLGSTTTQIGMMLDSGHANEPTLIYGGVLYYGHPSAGTLILTTTP